MIADSILKSLEELKDVYKIEVKLTYFKETGKYYSEESYMEDYIPLFEIWDRIRNMEKLPGLTGKWDGPILVNVPDHIHSHPRIIWQGEKND